MTTESRDGDTIEPQGMRAVIDALCDGDPGEQLALRELVVDLGRSTFGVLLFVATLPAFIPVWPARSAGRWWCWSACTC
jgi:hypothetical protein